MQGYLSLLEKILSTGEIRKDRTKTGTLAIFGHHMHFDLTQGFPLLTTKKLHTRSIIHELLWFLSGSTNIAYLRKHNVRIWEEWANEAGEVGPLYGKQWRAWPSYTQEPIDQLQNVITSLRDHPHGRRHIVSAWNVGSLPDMGLMPCHILFQFYVSDNNTALSCQWYQRSADVFLGLPFNIASYALLTAMVASVCGLKAKSLHCALGDAHLYRNHLPQAQEQLKRTPKTPPILQLSAKKDLNDFRYEDIQIMNYHAHPHIPAKVSV